MAIESDQTTANKLRAAVTAIKQKRRQEARALLLEVIEKEEGNEHAWLWLSAIAESTTERRICLENVLTINPDNPVAQKKLAELPPQPVQDPNIPADVQMQQRTNELEFGVETRFNDVWSRIDDVDLCAYCAYELAMPVSRCPNCRRRLQVYAYRYEKPSTSFHVFWILLASLVQLFLIQVIIDLMSGQSLPTIIWHGIYIPVFAILALFTYLRRFWAYVAGMATLFTAALLLSTELFLPNLLDVFMGPVAATPLRGLYEGIFQYISFIVRTLQVGAVGLGLFYGFFLVAPDFARDRFIRLATIDRRARRAGAAASHLMAESYAKEKMLASAILHWQQALVQDPGRLNYYMHLADTYHLLGFEERALNTLESAYKILASPAAQNEIQQRISEIQSSS